jgi:hypothetical protein
MVMGWLCLVPVSLAVPPSSRSLELPSLALDVRLGLGVGNTSGSEVLDGLTTILRTTKEESVGTSGSTESELVKGENTTTSLHNTSTSCGRHLQRGDGEGRDLEQTRIIRHCTNDNDDLVLLPLGVTNDAGEGDDRPVDLGLEQTLQHDTVEGAISPPGQEAIELDQETEVGVVRLWGVTVRVLDTTTTDQINTLHNQQQQQQ